MVVGHNGFQEGKQGRVERRWGSAGGEVCGLEGVVAKEVAVSRGERGVAVRGAVLLSLQDYVGRRPVAEDPCCFRFGEGRERRVLKNVAEGLQMDAELVLVRVQEAKVDEEENASEHSVRAQSPLFDCSREKLDRSLLGHESVLVGLGNRMVQ